MDAERSPVAPLAARPASGACRGGDRDRHDRGLLRQGAPQARGVLRARDLPGAHAARRRAGPAVPVHLRALALAGRARGRPRQRRGAIRAGEGARGLRPVRVGREEARAPRGGHRALPPQALPRDGDRGAGAVPRHPRRRLRALGRRRRPARGGRVGAPPAPLRRRRPARGVGLGLPGAAGAARRRARGSARPRLRARRVSSTRPTSGSSSRSTGRS